MRFSIKNFGKEGFIYKVIAILFLAAIFFVVIKNINALEDEASFKAISKKPYEVSTDKKNAFNRASNVINNVVLENNAIGPSNLNLAKNYSNVVDDEDKKILL